MVPKQVEFFQDKVQKFPEQSPALRELERQAIYRAHEKASETVQVAIAEKASTNVVKPAKEVEKLTEAVATVTGPPKKQPDTNVASEAIAIKLESSVAKFNEKVEEFKAENNENVGKKIEDTGLIKVGYIWWVGGVLAVVFVLWMVIKVALSALAASNPLASLGLNAVHAASGVVSKGFAQLVKGGEDFKSWVEKEVSDPAVKQKILDAFRITHMQAQDSDVQNTVQALTK